MVSKRIGEFIEFKGISVYAFENSIGASRGSISKAIKDDKNIGSNVLENILNEYRDLSPSWLLTGSGKMFINNDSLISEPEEKYSINHNCKGVPYYDVDFVGGFELVFGNQTIKPSYFIDFAPFNKSDAWINVTGESMSPIISHGDFVALKQITDSSWKKILIYGEIYAIVTEEFRTIKIIGKGIDNDHFTLIPYNKASGFSEQQIPIDIITHIFQVKGSIKKFC